MTQITGKYTSADVFTTQIEDYAVAQIKLLCDQPSFEGCHIAIMPDVHPGKVGPIGFTSTVGRAVMPGIVGVDIGCGMTMAKQKKPGNPDFVKLDKVIAANVPSGTDRRKTPHRFADDFDFDRLRCVKHINVDRARDSLGTLGGGNHFIEIDKSEDKEFYCVIHSGSRHLGKEVAEYYLKAGQNALKDAGKDIPYELTWLEGALKDDYLADIAVVQEFAEESRRAMLDEILKGMKWKTEDVASCVHNYVDFSGENKVFRN